jgi:hypothetical protein
LTFDQALKNGSSFTRSLRVSTSPDVKSQLHPPNKMAGPSFGGKLPHAGEFFKINAGAIVTSNKSSGVTVAPFYLTVNFVRFNLSHHS